MKRLTLCVIALVLSGGCGLLNAQPTKREPNRVVQKELRDVVRRIERLVRSGSAVDASNVLADAILQCLYDSIKIDLAAILAKACTIESSIDGIMFTIVDSVDNAAQSLSFTICEKLEPLQPEISFTVCDAVRFVQENLSFTIADGVSNAGASLAFTVCDKVESSCEQVKFTVVDKITNLVASLGFTICDAFANALPGTDTIAGVVINKVHGAQESLAFTICDKLAMMAEDAASMLDKACSILDQLPLDPIDIEPIKYTVCDKAETLSSKVDDLELCFPTPITQADFLADDILILENDVPSTSKTYCLSEDVFFSLGNEVLMILMGDDISVDLNDHKLQGRVEIQGDRSVIKNGTICPLAPISNSEADDPAVDIRGDKAQVLNCIIQNANTTLSDVDGRLGILITGTEAKVAHCCIIAGDGVDEPGGDATDGGVGIRLFGAHQCRIIDCEIRSGSGGSGDNAGDSGDGICIDSSNNNCIVESIVTTGDAGFGTINGGNAGHGIFLKNGAEDNLIQACSIKRTGSGGEGVTTRGGNGSDGVRISADVDGTKVFQCTIAHTGAGGASAMTPGADGLAVNDFNSMVLTISGASAIFDNFAYDIANTFTRYNIHNTGTEAGQDLAMPPDNLANVFVP